MSQFILHANDKGRDQIRENCAAFLAMLPLDQSWSVSIEKYAKEYSAKQRRSIFGPAYKALMEFSGLEGDEDKRELHRFMCGEYFGWRDVSLGRKPIRTTTKNEFGKRDPMSIERALYFYAFLQRKGASVGCYVPDPDPFWREHLEKDIAA